MSIISHLVTIGFAVSPSLVRIRRIAVEERFLAVVPFDDFNGRSVLELDAQEALGDLWKMLNGGLSSRVP